MTRYIYEQNNVCTVYRGVEVKGKKMEDGVYRFGNATEVLELVGLTKGRYGWGFNALTGSVLFYARDRFDSFGYADIGDFILMNADGNYLITVTPELLKSHYKALEDAGGKEAAP